jgi:mannose-6-phosphate isomerase-like protein (cupin superfamily)
MNHKLSPLEVAQSLSDYWSPKVISELNDSYVKVAKLKGEFVWHSHKDEDELFMILKGQLAIHFRDRIVHLETGEVYVVPKGVEHNPVAEQECLVMLIENKSTLHTGETLHKKSKSIHEQLNQ